MLEAERAQHLSYNSYEHSESTNIRNNRKFLVKYDDTKIEVPQDREGTFETTKNCISALRN